MSDPLLKIDFFDVGQGDCTVIHLPSGKLLVVDVGPVGSPLVDWLSERRPPLKIESIVLTHNDTDHAGALNSIVKDHGARIRTIWMLVDRDSDTPQFKKLIRKAAEGHKQGLFQFERLEVGKVLWSDPASDTNLRVVHPSLADNVLASNPNDSSAVIVLMVGVNTLIGWPGDLEVRRTSEVLGNRSPELLFGPHHGGPSDYPTRRIRKTDRALSGLRMREIRQAVEDLSPKRSFISVGSKNSYQHPRPGYLKLLARHGSKISCSQLTRCCDRAHLQTRRHVLPGSGLLGLRPPRSGTSCRGAMRYYLQDGVLIPDEFEQEHRNRVSRLLRPQCL